MKTYLSQQENYVFRIKTFKMFIQRRRSLRQSINHHAISVRRFNFAFDEKCLSLIQFPKKLVKNFQEFFGKEFLRNSPEFLETMSFIQFPIKSVKLGTKYWEFRRNFQWNIPEIFLGISWEKFRKISQEFFLLSLVFSSPKNPKKWGQSFDSNFSGISWISRGKIPVKFSGI